MSQRNWQIQPQEREGDYFFDGKILMTSEVANTLTPEEISAIIVRVKMNVIAMDGLDYLQVFKSDDGLKIYVIDQLSKSMLEGDDYTEEQKEEYHYFTILFSHEY